MPVHPLTFVSDPPQSCSSIFDGLIPGVLAYAARADWSGLEFSLLRDNRHAVAYAEMCLYWWIWEGGGVLVGWLSRKGGRHDAECEAI